jgi:hypothetical protein
MTRLTQRSAAVVLSLLTWQSFAGCRTDAAEPQHSPEPSDITVESFQVLDLPLNIADVTLTRTEKGYLIKGTFSNNSDRRVLGLRYLLVVVDATNEVRPAISRTESCRLAAYATRRLTFRTPLKLKLEKGVRVELLIDQVVGDESIWEVLKARQALEAYASGDYSLMPKVLRVPNQIDAPLDRIN